MPIKKYKSFEDASKDLWVLNPGKDYYDNLKNLFELWQRLYKPKIKNKLVKYKNINDPERKNYFK